MMWFGTRVVFPLAVILAQIVVGKEFGGREDPWKCSEAGEREKCAQEGKLWSKSDDCKFGGKIGGAVAAEDFKAFTFKAKAGGEWKAWDGVPPKGWKKPERDGLVGLVVGVSLSAVLAVLLVVGMMGASILEAIKDRKHPTRNK